MTSAPAYSALPALPDGVPPQSSASSSSPHDSSGQQSSFATLLHQAKDDANNNADERARDAQERDKNTNQAQAAPTPAPVPPPQQTAAPTHGAPALSGTAGKSEKSAGQGEDDAKTASASEKKPDAGATAAGITLLMQALAGLGIPQFTPMPAGQQPANHQAGKSRADVAAGVVTAAANPQALLAAESPGTTSSASSSSSASAVASASSGKDSAAESPVSTAPTAGDGKASQPTGQLAFAARLTADASSAQSSPQTQAQASRLQNAQANVQTSPAQEGDAIQPPVTPVQAASAGTEQAVENAQKTEIQTSSTTLASEQVAAARADTAQAPEQVADVRAADVDPAPAAGANATAVRDVQLQVPSGDNQHVDVRVMDRGGELRVSVRADDPSLVRSLQDNVADLSTRLDQAHFQSEVWTPRTQAISQADSASTNGRTFSNGDETSPRDGQGQQQHGRQHQQPFWVDDFEENPTGRNSGGTQQWQP